MNATQRRYAAALAAVEAAQAEARARVEARNPATLEERVALEVEACAAVGLPALIREWRAATRELLTWGQQSLLPLCRPGQREELAYMFEHVEQFPTLADKAAAILMRLRP